MENEIGEALVIRSQNGVTPTEKGEEIYQGASQILGITQSWVSPQQQEDEVIHIKVDIAPMLEHTFFGDILNELGMRYPKIAFYTNVVSITEKTFPAFAENNLTFTGYYREGIDKVNQISRDNELFHCFASPLMLYVNKNNPLASRKNITREDLKNQEIIVNSHAVGYGDPFMKLYDPQKISYTPFYEQVVTIVANTQKVNILPAFLSSFPLYNLPNVTLLPIIDYPEYYYATVCYSRKSKSKKILRSLVDYSTAYPFCDTKGCIQYNGQNSNIFYR